MRDPISPFQLQLPAPHVDQGEIFLSVYRNISGRHRPIPIRTENSLLLSIWFRKCYKEAAPLDHTTLLVSFYRKYLEQSRTVLYDCKSVSARPHQIGLSGVKSLRTRGSTVYQFTHTASESRMVHHTQTAPCLSSTFPRIWTDSDGHRGPLDIQGEGPWRP